MKFKVLLILLMLFTLAGCGSINNKAPAALPTVVLDAARAAPGTSSQVTGDGVTASGMAVPAQEAQLAFTLGGKVETVEVAVGDQVMADQVLVRITGKEQLAAALSVAELDVLTAQQALEDFQKHQPLKIAQAQSALEDAKSALNDLLNPSEATIAEAQTAVLDAQEAAEDAQKYVDYLKYDRASQQTIAAAEAAYIVAQSEVDRLEKVYKNTGGDPTKSAAKAQALAALEAAKSAANRALINLNWLKSDWTQEEIDQKNADLALAKAQLADAEETLQKLTNPSAEDIALAEAVVADAQQTLDELKAGPDGGQMALLQARLESAQKQADAARASLANLELKAPFNGTVGEVYIQSGEWVIPGQPILVLADLDHMRIETTDLSERDIPKIEIGQPVTVFVKALNQDMTGHVSKISPLADTLGGDVVYKTTVEVDTRPDGLRAGMSVEVQFGTGP
jgi:multidrug efflux pump subunit AcrA (membrane-fusion protein)